MGSLTMLLALSCTWLWNSRILLLAPFGVSSETSFWLPVLASAIWVFYFGTSRRKPFRADLSQPLEPLRYWLPSPIRRLFYERQWELTPIAISGYQPLSYSLLVSQRLRADLYEVCELRVGTQPTSRSYAYG